MLHLFCGETLNGNTKNSKFQAKIRATFIMCYVSVDLVPCVPGHAFPGGHPGGNSRQPCQGEKEDHKQPWDGDCRFGL